MRMSKLNIYKSCFFGVFFFLIVNQKQASCNKAPQDDNIIVWDSKRKLKWDDFKGVRSNPDVNVGGESSISIKYEYVVKRKLKRYDVVCFFTRSKSWTTATDEYHLNHEQKHFDIGEIYARKLRKWFAENRRIITDDNYRIMDSVYYQHIDLMRKAQDEYDAETRWSMLKMAQWNWNEEIDKQLKELEGYKK